MGNEIQHTHDFTHDLKTLIVATLCLSGAALGGYSLYKDFNSQGAAGKGEPMGQIERRESKVRRKSSSSYVWNKARAQESVYRNDSIETGPGSAVAIKFSAGESLEIGENSLLVIDDISNLALGFKTGSVIIRRTDGTDSKISVGSDGKAKVEQLSVRLAQPEALAKYYVPIGSPKQITFRWNVLGKTTIPESGAIEISSDRSFKAERTKKFPLAGVSQTQIELTPGRYFWRIAASDQALTEVAQFKILPVYPLKPTYPSIRDRVAVFGDESPVQFRWTSGAREGEGSGDLADISADHEIEVARDAEFKNILSHSKIDSSSGTATLKKIEQGGYFWRVKSQYGDLALVSRVEKFKVERATRVEIELSRPAQASNLELPPELRLAWSAPLDKLTYQLDLRASDGTQVVNESTSLNNFVWKTTQPGAYKWRVIAFDANRQNIGESTWNTFIMFQGKTLALIEPKKAAKIEYWEDPAPFSFKWSADSAVEEKNYKYMLELAQDAEFKSIFKTASPGKPSISSTELGLIPGKYFWRVKLTDPSGVAIKTSEVSTLSYGIYPALPAPEILAPVPAATFSLIDDDFAPKASWSSINGAKFYDVSVSRVEGREPAVVSEKVVIHETTSDTSFDLKKLPLGQYRITVRAADRIKRLGESESARSFSIGNGQTIEPPEVVSPVVQ